MWKVFCSKDTCKNKIYVEHWTDVKRCLKHKILFRLHMLSSFHSSIHLAQNLFSVFFHNHRLEPKDPFSPWISICHRYFAYISKPIKEVAEWNAIFYQIIILVLSPSRLPVSQTVIAVDSFGYHYIRSFVSFVPLVLRSIICSLFLFFSCAF